VRNFALALLLATACSDHGQPSVKRDPEHTRRVTDEAPTRAVRSLPPYAIRADGVGPYRLGTSLAELLDQLPSGPRIVQYNVPGVVHRDLLRAEDDAILIGGEPQGKASFVAVVRDEQIARTESNLHIGSTPEEVVRALGSPIDDPDRARDPRIIVPSSMRNLHVVVSGDRVVALVVTADRVAGTAAAAGSGDCQRPEPDPDKPHSFGACMSGGGEVVSYDSDEITVVARDGRAPSASVRGLVFAAPLRTDGRDELVAVARSDEGQSRVWSLVAYRLEGGVKLVRSLDPTPLYTLTAASARWIGADLHDLDLYLELSSHPDSIEVGGLLTTSTGDKIRDIIVISPVPVPRRRAKSAPPEAADAGTSEAGSENGSDHRAH
jgi:hypothetical protein